jgi:GntR family transcriptional regulator, carbon starvation induced regulator
VAVTRQAQVEVSEQASGDQTTLVEHCYRTIKRDIIRGTRPPGERLRIEKLRAAYGMGTSPIREALQRLTGDGLVRVLERRGFQVAPIELAEFFDLNTARTEVELSALRLSMIHGDHGWEAGIVAAAYRLEKGDALLGRSDTAAFDEWEELNRTFHWALLSACPSRWLLRARDALNEQCERYRRASVFRARSERNLLQEHKDISEAVLARDVPLAERRLREHFSRTAAGLERALSDD